MPSFARSVGAFLDRWRAPGLPILLMAALGLRLFGIDWDQGHLFHPDERYIIMTTEGIKLPFPVDLGLLVTPQSPLNPHGFAYGSLIFYQLRLLQWVVGTIAGVVGLTGATTDWLDPGMNGLRLLGRALSALFDTGTVYLTFLLGKKLYGRKVGILAALFVAFAVIHIQYSHFYASDTPMTFWATAALVASAYFMESGARRHALGAAAAMGLSLASKISAAPVLAAIAASHALRYAVPTDQEIADGAPPRVRLTARGLNLAIGAFLGCLVVTLLVAVACEPYVLIDFKTFVQNTVEQSAIARGIADVPYTRQYANRPAYWYFVQNVALFGVGLPLGVAMFVGWLYVAIRAIRFPNRADLMLLAFVVPYFAITGDFHQKFLRYMLPIMPVLALFAAVGLVRLYEWARSQPAWSPWALPSVRVAVAAAGVTIVGTVLYGIAYENVYVGEFTAVQASRWIYANVPRGSTLANEHWEEGFPVGVMVDGPNGGQRQLDPGVFGYRQVTLNLYENDDPAKLQQLAQTLARTDYILFFSNRLYGTIPRLPDRYPMSTEYYKKLFGEQLGFQLVAAFEKYPRLGPIALVNDTFAEPGLPTPALLQDDRPAPITINLGRADEAFSVYDHPKVLIFKKVQPVTEAQVRAALQPALVQGRPNRVAPELAGGQTYRSLLLSPEQALRDRLGGTYSQLFDRDGLVNQIPLPVWIVSLVVVGVLSLPITVLAFPRLADGGLPLARTIGILAMTWFTWIAVGVGGLPAGRPMTYLGLVVLAIVSLLFAKRALPRLRELWGARRRALLAGELAFWLPFAYLVWVRAMNPDLWHPARGGEKPMEIAYLMAAVKSTTFPPYDPWFAGGFLNYYYFGQIIAANLIKLTGVIPTTAFNLIVPTMYALTFAGAFSVGYNLCRRNGLVPERIALGGGALAAMFVTSIGNLGGALQILDGFARMAGVSYQSLLPGAQYLVLAAMGFVNWIVGGQSYPIGTDWYWTSTRVISGTINEFPYFTFLFADLHAHLIALPFTLLAIALAVNLVLSRPTRLSFAPFAETRLGFAMPVALPRTQLRLPPVRDLAQAVNWSVPEGALRLWLTGLVVGALLPINSWDFPTYLGLIAVASVAPWWLSPHRDLNGLLAALTRVGVIAVLSYLLFLPFHQNFVSFYTAVSPAPPEHSEVSGYLIIHGFFLAVLISGVVLDLAAGLRRAGFVRTLRSFAQRWDRLPHMLELRRRLIRKDDGSAALVLYGGAAMIAIAVVGAYLTFTLAGLLLALLVPVLWRLLARPRTLESAFVLLLFATGLALGAGCEFLVVGDAGRMNTVFKFYLQVWVMWGIASAVALVMMRQRLLGGLRRPGFGRWWTGLIVFLLACTLVYPVVGTRARVSDRFQNPSPIPWTLDGTAYMDTGTFNEDQPPVVQRTTLHFETDKKAIEWIWDNIPGSPVIAEANTIPNLYHWGSRISIYTGLPTIIGWDWHQTQQRLGFRYMIDERLRDLKQLYSDPSPDRVVPILAKYHVGYIYVGELEHAYYPDAGLRKFDQMVGRELELVYDQDGVKIYKVLSEA